MNDASRSSPSMRTDASPALGWYVTGTDTGVGKTWASEALLHRLHAAGLRAVGMKPVASGCVRTDEGWRNEDALRLQAASAPTPTYDAVNPYALPSPTAPSLAAAEVGVRIDLAHLVSSYRSLAAQADAVVVEGVGGWAAPLDRGLEQADLVRALALPVILVVGLRLGCLNHARLTARAVRADGLSLVGWIANRIDPDFRDADAYLALLDEALETPRLGVLLYGASPSIGESAMALALPAGVSSKSR